MRDTEPRRRVLRGLRSVRVQGLLLAVILIVLPVLVSAVLSNADRERRLLILRAVQETGDAVAAGLLPLLQGLHLSDVDQLQQELARFSAPDRSIKVLLRPSGSEQDFYLIATEPPIFGEELEAERRQLVDLGILPDLSPGCSARFLRDHNTSTLDNGAQVLTSVASADGDAGCWAIVIATGERQVLGVLETQPYWARREVRLAMAIYAAMAALIVVMFAGIWTNLLRFRRLALSSGTPSGFASMTNVPELAPMASAFDAMVQRLHQSAEMLRQAAEDNAHAFKGPIGTIRLAIDPPQGRNAGPDGMGAETLSAGAMRAISLALDRLDGLVTSARFLDTAAAELLEPQYDRVDLSKLVEAFVASCVAMNTDGRVVFEARIEDGLVVMAEPATLETILETLVDNAISFSSPGGMITVTLTAQDDTAIITIEDEGPGIAPDRIDRVFERYYTHRTGEAATAHASAQHFGVGLWLARQNTLSLGGQIEVVNREPHGLRVSVMLPLADAD